MVMSYEKGRAGAHGYYLQDLDDEEASFCAPSWYVSGADASPRYMLGADDAAPWVEGDVHRFTRLVQGLNPVDGSALVRNHAHQRRVALHDLTLSAPKSVSVAWALAPSPVAQRIAKAQLAATRAALDLMGQHVVMRLGQGGKDKRPARWMGALFSHGNSRSMDPQLHTHSVMMNLSQRTGGSTCSIDLADALAWRGVAASLHKVELAHQLVHMGLPIVQRGQDTLFELLDVPAQVCRAFSTRRQEVERVLQTSGSRLQRDESTLQTRAASRLEAKRAAMVSRPAKQHAHLAVLRHQWRLKAQTLGLRWDEVEALRQERLSLCPFEQTHHDVLLTKARWALAQHAGRHPVIKLTDLCVRVAAALMGQANAAQTLQVASDVQALLNLNQMPLGASRRGVQLLKLDVDVLTRGLTLDERVVDTPSMRQ